MLQKKTTRCSEVEEKDLTSVKITCVFCGRKRKKGLSRSALFCTKHCQTRWQDSHPGELPIPIQGVPTLLVTKDSHHASVHAHFWLASCMLALPILLMKNIPRFCSAVHFFTSQLATQMLRESRFCYNVAFSRVLYVVVMVQPGTCNTSVSPEGGGGGGGSTPLFTVSHSTVWYIAGINCTGVGSFHGGAISSLLPIS